MRDNLGRFIKGVKKQPFTKTHKSNMSKAKRGKNNPLYGVKPSKATLLKRSKALKGKIPWNKGKKCPQLATNWQGGKSTIHEILRHSLEYRLWRTAVFERDNYTCIWCGQVGGKLNADHIKPFAYYPELRFAIDNGRTLCESCHKTTDTYKQKKPIREYCYKCRKDEDLLLCDDKKIRCFNCEYERQHNII